MSTYKRGVDLDKENPGVGDSPRRLAAAQLRMHKSNRNLRSGKGLSLAHVVDVGRCANDRQQSNEAVTVVAAGEVHTDKKSVYVGLLNGINCATESIDPKFGQSHAADSDDIEMRVRSEKAEVVFNVLRDEHAAADAILRSFAEAKSITKAAAGVCMVSPTTAVENLNSATCNLTKFNDSSNEAVERATAELPAVVMTAPPLPTERVVSTMRSILQSSMAYLNFRSALFWCDKLITLTQSDGDMLTKCKLLHQLREFRRCIGFIDRCGLAKRHERFRYFKALCLFEMREFDSALKELDECLKPEFDNDDADHFGGDDGDGHGEAKVIGSSRDVPNAALRSFITPAADTSSNSSTVERQLTSDFLNSSYVRSILSNETSLNCRRAVNFDDSTHAKSIGRPPTSAFGQNTQKTSNSSNRPGNLRRTAATNLAAKFSDATPNTTNDDLMVVDDTMVDASLMRFNAIRASTRELPSDEQKLNADRRSLFSAVYLLRGRIFFSLQNRALSIRSLVMSLLIDSTNYAAIDCLVHDISLAPGEATRLLNDVESERERWAYGDPIAFDVLIQIYRNIACAADVADGGGRRCTLELGADRMRSFFHAEAAMDEKQQHYQIHNDETTSAVDADTELSPVIKTNFVPNKQQNNTPSVVTRVPPPPGFAVPASPSGIRLPSVNNSSIVDEQENVIPQQVGETQGFSAGKPQQQQTRRQRRFKPYETQQQRRAAATQQNRSPVIDNFATPLAAAQQPRPSVAAASVVDKTPTVSAEQQKPFSFSAMMTVDPLGKNDNKSTIPFVSWTDKAVIDCNAMCRKLNDASIELCAARAKRQFALGDFRAAAMLTADLLFHEPFYLDIMPTHLGALVRLATIPSNNNNVGSNHADAVSSKPVADIFQLSHSLVNVFPQHAISWYAVACFYYVTGKYDLARRFLLKSSTMNPNMGDLWLLLGHCFAIDAEHDQATSAYFHAAHVLPSSHVPLHFIAKEYLRTDSLTLAAKFIDDALAINSSDPELLLDAGMLNIRKQQQRAATACLPAAAEDALMMNDELNDDASTEQSFYVSALDYLRQAEHYIHLNFDDRPKALLESVLYHIGYCEMRLNRLKQAIEHFEQARQIDSANVDTLKCLAWCYACERNKSKAMLYANQCAALRTNLTKNNFYHPTSYYHNGGMTNDIQISNIFGLIVGISASSPAVIVDDGSGSSPTESAVWSDDEDDDTSSVMPQNKNRPATSSMTACRKAAVGKKKPAKAKRTGVRQQQPQSGELL